MAHIVNAIAVAEDERTLLDTKDDITARAQSQKINESRNTYSLLNLHLGPFGLFCVDWTEELECFHICDIVLSLC